MSLWRDPLDDRPGVMPDSRILSDSTVLVIFDVAWGVTPATSARLVLRFDQTGHISAALQHAGAPDAMPDDLPR